jgi:hypothetical protein
VAIIREHWPAFRERVEMHAGPLPAFVCDEIEAFATCGDFEQGFLVAECRRCGDSMRVPFACKSRGICPSCMGRRMGETAALLVDHRLPAVPWRQWVLSFEGPMAVRLGYDAELLALVCQRFATRVMQTLRRQSKLEHELTTSRTLHSGVLVVVQRFRSDLGLYVHLHALAMDGCFEAVGEDEVRFLPVEQLSPSHLVGVLDRLHRDLAEHLEDDGEPPDEGLAACVQLGLSRPPLRAVLTEQPHPAPMHVSAFGMQLHAAVTVDGRDRNRLERVCRYLLRPPFAHDAVERTADGQVRVHFKAPSKSGATYTQMSPDTFLARLCALVPPPSFNMTRYFGLLANRHALRPRIVPDDHAHEDEPKQLALFLPRNDHELAAITQPLRDEQLRDRPPARLSWMKLLARVFRIDLSVCSRCGGPMRIVRAVTEPDAIAAELHGARAPPQPSPPGQLKLFTPS